MLHTVRRSCRDIFSVAPKRSLSQALFPGLAAEAVESVIRLIGEGFLDWNPPPLVAYIAGLDFISPSPDDKPIYFPWRTAKERVRGGQNKALKQRAKPGVSRRNPVEFGPLPRILEAWYLREGRGSPEKNLANRFPSLGIPCGGHIWVQDFP